MISIYFVLTFFIITAITGVILFRLVKKGKRRPIALVAFKTIVANASWALLFYYIAAVQYGAFAMDRWYATPQISFTFFSFGATLGFYMLIRDKIQGKSLPIWLPSVHALFNTVGLILLIVYAVSGDSVK